MTTWATVQAELPKRWADTVPDIDAVPIEERRDLAERCLLRHVDSRLDEDVDAWCLGFPAGDFLLQVHRGCHGGVFR